MVKRINRVSGSEASTRTESGHTLNLGSDSLNAWVAARQSKINHDIAERQRQTADQQARDGFYPSEEERADDAPSHNVWAETPEAEAAAESGPEPRLSGESERIGTQNFDDDTPFGERVVIV